MKVVMPLDRSEFSSSDFPVAHRLLEVVAGVELHLLTVIDPRAAEGIHGSPVEAPIFDAFGSVVRTSTPNPAESHGEALERVHREAVEWLEGIAKGELHVPAVVHVEWSSKPVDAIVATAATIDAEVVLMPTHGRSGLSHMSIAGVMPGWIARVMPVS